MTQCNLCNKKANHRVSKSVNKNITIHANLCDYHYRIYSMLPNNEKFYMLYLMHSKH